MADSDDDIPVLDVEDEERVESGRNSKKERRNTEIPNFRGKVPDADKDDDSKGSLQIKWDGDEAEEDTEDDEDESEFEELPEGEVGEEFAKARREALRQKREQRLEDEEGDSNEVVMEEEELWNFPPDTDNWEEEDIGEEWADPWDGDEKTGFDPDLVDDWDEVAKLWEKGEGPPARPWYVPYRKFYPLIPEDHPDIRTPQDVVHELDRYEEFLVWRSYIFKDGSSYEGTVFDDLAHGKGVYTTALELCRYEGEWLQNAMEGHGVLEADLPINEPHPDSEEAKKWRAQGKILQNDYLDDEEKEWLKMDIEDTMELGDITTDSNPFEDDEAWVKKYGEKPEKGRYRYAGQWKHSRMHGCGLYEVNGKQLYGQFYFGELLPAPGDCDENQVAIHAGLAEIAAAKARMFILKPDGMVREAKGPYTDPSHPYMYEEEDMWMAPGFINGFYKVPETWERYVEEVDEEQEMWLNSFIKSPFRIPMPAELEYQWAHDDEFIVLSNKDSNPMYQYPENLDPEVEGDILLHTPTGNLINWAEDPDGNLRFFLQPYSEDGEIRPEEAIPLPLGFDEFMGLVDEDGNPLDESRRGLSLEERRKLDKEDQKKETKVKFQAKIDAMRQKRDEKLKQVNTELYIKDLERRVQNVLLEESFRAELEAVDEEYGSVVKEEDKETAPEDQNEKRVSTATEEGSLSSADEMSEAEDKRQDGGDSHNGSEKDEEDESSDDDEDDKKPRSFGTVAMVFPEENKNNKHSQGGSSHPPFPTIFASLSLVPQMAAKQVLESSIRIAQRAWSSQFGARVSGGSTIQQNMGVSQGEGESVPRLHQVSRGLSSLNSLPVSKVVKAQKFAIPRKPNVTSLRLHHSSPGTKLPISGLPHTKRMPATENLLLAFKVHQKSSISRRVNKSPEKKNLSRSQVEQKMQQLDSAVWVLPDMEVLSLALPVQIL